MSNCVGFAESAAVVIVAFPVISEADPKIVVPLMNVTCPVGDGVLPTVADTTALRVTVVPTRTGLVGLTVNDVSVGLPGGGGSGIEPSSAMDISFTLPA